MTKDGHLVVRHENEISQTTDVAPAARSSQPRKTTKPVQGQAVTGWFTEDFTLDELKTIRCRERLPKLRPESAKFDGQESDPDLPGGDRPGEVRERAAEPRHRHLSGDEARQLFRGPRPADGGPARRHPEEERPGQPDRAGLHPVLRRPAAEDHQDPVRARRASSWSRPSGAPDRRQDALQGHGLGRRA